MLVDSHCHLTDQQFVGDRLEVLVRARAAGVEKILSIASDRRDAEGVLALVATQGKPGVDAEKDPPDALGESPHLVAPGKAAAAEMVGETTLDGQTQMDGLPGIWGTAGVHPHEAKDAQEGDLDAIRETAMAHPRIVAIGETGLDFFYDSSPRALQEQLFRDHLALAQELGLPVVVHSRSADGLTAEIIREWGSRVSGVLHCFTGGSNLLDTALGAGWMVSFTGIVTFKKYDGQPLVRRVPRDRLMVETDAPYLAPVPHRGKRNEPSFVSRIAQEMAEIRGEDLETVQGYTSDNATRFFNLVS